MIEMKEEEGISLLEIWKRIMSRKLIFYSVFAIITLFMMLFLMFIYNRINVTYQITVHYDWYGLDKNAYADGKVFNYYDVISEENLEKAKQKHEKYHSLDVIELSEMIEIKKENDDYLIRVQGAFFPNDKLAKDYLIDLVMIPFETAWNLSFEFNTNLIGYDEAKKMYAKLDYLDKHLSLMKSGYQGLINYFGNTNYNQTNLRANLEALEVFEVNKPISLFRNLVYKNTYMTKDEYLSLQYEQQSLETEKRILRKRRDALFSTIEELYQITNQPSSIDTSLTSYLNSLHEIDVRLLAIEDNLLLIEQANAGQYQEEKSEAFLKELDSYKNQLEEFSDIYTEAVLTTLRQNTFMNVKKFDINGRISVLFTALISVVGGLVVGAFFAYIYRRKEA